MIRPAFLLLVLSACSTPPSVAALVDASPMDRASDEHDAAVRDATLSDFGHVASDAGIDGGASANIDASLRGDAAVFDGAGPDAEAWRSVLYPEEWTPSHTVSGELFLHDFSYAGYHNGEAELGAYGPTNVIDAVTSFGADPTGSRDTTTDVQNAIDSLDESGGVVYLPSGLYRFDGILRITHSNIVLRGAGPDATRLYFTRFTEMRDHGHIEVIGALSGSLQVPLASDAQSRADFVEVADSAALAVGDDVSVGWVISPEFVAEHDMNGIWQVFNDRWQAFFRRNIVAIDRTVAPHRVYLDVPLRHAARVRDGATLRRESGYLHEVGIESLAVSNAVAGIDAWSGDLVSVIRIAQVKDAWVRDLRSFASPLSPTTTALAGFHLQSRGITVVASKRVTVADSRLERAENRGSGGNGYLFEMVMSNEILFRDLVGRGGRHNFIQNYGFGTTGCVWLRVHSYEGQCDLSYPFAEVGLGATCSSEFHHSLAMANLVDSSVFDDGMKIINRGTESSGAGQTGTENVLWNTSGGGTLVSMQYGHGYLIGTTGPVVQTDGTISTYPMAYSGTAPNDFTEGLGVGFALEPQSLYEDQLARRLRP